MSYFATLLQTTQFTFIDKLHINTDRGFNWLSINMKDIIVQDMWIYVESREYLKPPHSIPPCSKGMLHLLSFMSRTFLLKSHDQRIFRKYLKMEHSHSGGYIYVKKSSLINRPAI